MLKNKIPKSIEYVLSYDKLSLSTYPALIPSTINISNILQVIDRYNDKDKIIQLVDERICFSNKQLKLAGILAIKSFREQTNVSSKPQIEYLLYLAATTQIKDAIKKIGAKQGGNNCLIIITTEEYDHKQLLRNIIENTGILIDKRRIVKDTRFIKEVYNISLDTIEDILESIILTKIAVLDAYK